MKHKIAKGTMAAGLSLAFILGVSTFADAKGDQYQTGLAGSAAAMEQYTESDSSAPKKKVKAASAAAAVKKTTKTQHITEVKKQPAATSAKPKVTAKQPTAAAVQKKTKEPEFSASFYRGKAAPNVRSVLNIRKKKSISSPVVGKFKKGNIGTVLKKGKEWSRIRSGKVTGYVKNEYLIWGSNIHSYAKEHNFPKKAVVKADTLKVRQKQSTKAKVLTLVSRDDSYKVLRESAEWVNVKADGDKGYLAKDYVSIGYYYTSAKSTVKKSKPAKSTTSTERTTESERQNSSSQESGDSSSGTTRQQVVNYALKFVGNKYRYGGNSLTNGTDCSGFTQQVLGHFCYNISRTSYSQANDGRTISISSVKPGDLLFYKRGGRINHVTMYIGNGQVVHASNSAPYPRGGIKVSGIGYRTPCKAVRIIN